VRIGRGLGLVCRLNNGGAKWHPWRPPCLVIGASCPIRFAPKWNGICFGFSCKRNLRPSFDCSYYLVCKARRDCAKHVGIYLQRNLLLEACRTRSHYSYFTRDWSEGFDASYFLIACLKALLTMYEPLVTYYYIRKFDCNGNFDQDRFCFLFPLKIDCFSLARLNSAPPGSLKWAFHLGAWDVTRDGEANSLPRLSLHLRLKKL
jgi:hypothetical protein